MQAPDFVRCELEQATPCAIVVVALPSDDFVSAQTGDQRVRERWREGVLGRLNERPLQGRCISLHRVPRPTLRRFPATLGLG